MSQTKVVEKTKTHISYSITLLESHAVYEIMWKNMLQPDRPHDMRFACWVTKVTDTHSQHAIFIALPRQQWFRERSTLPLYVNCLSLLRWGVFSPSPYLRLWDHPLSALHDCFFFKCIRSYRSHLEAISFGNPRPRHTVVKGSQLHRYTKYIQ